MNFWYKQLRIGIHKSNGREFFFSRIDLFVFIGVHVANFFNPLISTWIFLNSTYILPSICLSVRLSFCACLFCLGCPRYEKENFSVRTETNRNKICFAFVSVCFMKPKTKFFGLFRCFEPLSKQPKQTELFRNELKQSGIFWKYLIIFSYKNMKTRRKNVPKHSLSYCSCSTTNMQRLRIKQKEAIRVITNAGYRDHTQHLFKKNTKPSFWTQWLNNLIFRLCTVISITIFPSLLNNYGYPTECCVMQMTCEFHLTTMRLSTDFLSSHPQNLEEESARKYVPSLNSYSDQLKLALLAAIVL